MDHSSSTIVSLRHFYTSILHRQLLRPSQAAQPPGHLGDLRSRRGERTYTMDQIISEGSLLDVLMPFNFPAPIFCNSSHGVSDDEQKLRLDKCLRMR